jgi:hypothetical protein
MGIPIKRLKLEKHKGKLPIMRWAILLVIVALGVAGCSRFFGKKTPEVKTETKTVSNVNTTNASPTPKPKPPFDTRTELFRAQMDGMLSTDKWIYRLGQMSPDGVVTAIMDGQVKIMQADGRPLFVLGDRRHRPEEGGHTTTIPEVHHEITVAPYHGLWGTGSDLVTTTAENAVTPTTHHK